MPSANSQIDVVAEANKDQIWIKSWRVLSQKLGRWARSQDTVTVGEKLAKQFNLEVSYVNDFLRTALNYTHTEISAGKINYRYAHYNQTALLEKLDDLTNVSLLGEKEVGIYEVTDRGSQLIAAYWNIRKSQFDTFPMAWNASIATIAATLEKVTASTMAFDDGTQNQSIKWRRQSWDNVKEELPDALLAQEFYKDFNAYNNDNAHYRFDRLIKSDPDKWKTLTLSPLEKELMAVMRNGREYTKERCYDHAFWQQPVNDCDKAFSTLKQMGYILANEGSFRQTDLGADIFAKAQEIANERFYRPWKVLSAEEYYAYRDAIDWLDHNIPEN